MDTRNLKHHIKNTLTSLTLPEGALEKLMDLKIPLIPSQLYKCRSFSKDAFTNLIDKTLWCAHPDSFNDPYECSLQATLAPDLKIQGMLTEAEESMDPLALEALKLVLTSRLERLSNEISSGFRARMKDIYKICALSERIDSILMWSHYGADHKGFAMEYDFCSLNRQHPLVRQLWPVIYEAQMLDISHMMESDERPRDFNNLFGIAAAIHKTEDWQYEKEWRLIIHSNTSKNVPAPLKAVYIGARAEPKCRDALIAVANFSGIPVYQMRLAERQFAMAFDQVA